MAKNNIWMTAKHNSEKHLNHIAVSGAVMSQPTIAFATLGCRVNQYDTQAMKEQTEKPPFRAVDFEAKADIYVINTCTVTAAADAESRLLIRRAKARNQNSFVVVTGCLAQDRPAEVKALAGVDLVLGNKEKSRLVREILRAYHQKNPPINAPRESPVSPWCGGISRFDGHQRAIVKVQEGCNFNCSFCVVPRVRGKVVSRPMDDILEEGKRLAANNVKELVLAGIQLSSYGRDWGLKTGEPRLAPVIEKLLGIPGIRRVRLSSYSVADFEEALLPLWEKGEGLCLHLHLPLQSGDTQVLNAMRRPYGLKRYREIVESIRKAAPRLGLTTDIITGFPGESEKAFQNTLDRIREFGFMDFHPFPYSDRPGTEGEAMRPKVPPAVIRKRMKKLLELKKVCVEKSAREAQGLMFPVIVERFGREGFSGLSPAGVRVFFKEKPGDFGREIRVQVDGLHRGRAVAHLVS
jgi:threonylcarbamoyladenosine tRNA methylthiotransferase MtaB